MNGQELHEHLEYMQFELSKLIKNFEEYQSLKSTKNKKGEITFNHHIIFVVAFIFIIVGATYGISSFH